MDEDDNLIDYLTEKVIPNGEKFSTLSDTEKKLRILDAISNSEAERIHSMNFWKALGTKSYDFVSNLVQNYDFLESVFTNKGNDMYFQIPEDYRDSIRDIVNVYKAKQNELNEEFNIFIENMAKI